MSDRPSRVRDGTVKARPGKLGMKEIVGIEFVLKTSIQSESLPLQHR